MKFSPTTAFAARCVEALVDAGLDQTAAARLISARVRRVVKPQTVQAMTQKGNSSALTADLAAITGWRYEYLAHGDLPKKPGEPASVIPVKSAPVTETLSITQAVDSLKKRHSINPADPIVAAILMLLGINNVNTAISSVDELLAKGKELAKRGQLDAHDVKRMNEAIRNTSRSTKTKKGTRDDNHHTATPVLGDGVRRRRTS